MQSRPRLEIPRLLTPLSNVAPASSDPLFPTDASHPAPIIDCFLQDVGGYNLTRLSATLTAVGITSMHDLIRLAQLPALNVVSLAHTIADLRSSDFSASSQQPGVTSATYAYARRTDESAPAAPPRTLRSSNVRAPAPVVLVERKAPQRWGAMQSRPRLEIPRLLTPCPTLPRLRPSFPDGRVPPCPQHRLFSARCIQSMHDLIRLAQLPAVRRVKTLTHIFDSYPDVTKLNVVSLAHTIADLRSSDFSASSQQPGVTSGSHPPALSGHFLMDVGGLICRTGGLDLPKLA
ncbi:hypothetical protein C8R43DRAFT_1138796 [Mycena crocata]|nr:hypothetical protein C8R43DRAFT_1138796 [Mycena crocata]